MRSLFLVSLPRSLSSLLYGSIRSALDLTEPAWTSNGEILNLQRFAHLPEGVEIEGLRFTHPFSAPSRFDRLVSFLDHAVVRDGYLYKDVVQPFVVARWLPASGLPALRIERPVADVAYAMADRGWYYPCTAADSDGGPERKLVEGLVRAARALAEVPGPVVYYNDLIHDEEPLAAALRSLYGAIPTPRYLDDGFREVCGQVLRRRDTERWTRLARMVREAGDGPEPPLRTR